MRRQLAAAFFSMLLALTGAASAQPLRFPASGPFAFVINLPPSWTSNEDKVNNGLQLFPDQRWGGIFLSMAQDAAYAGRPLRDLALAISKAAGIKDAGRDEPAAISGFQGTAYYGAMQNNSGVNLDTRLVIIPLATDYWATMTLITQKPLNPSQQQSLSQAVSAISLTR